MTGRGAGARGLPGRVRGETADASRAARNGRGREEGVGRGKGGGTEVGLGRTLNQRGA